MSLRDQLLAKGLVTKKRAKQVERELKTGRKNKQSSRKKKRLEQAEQAAREAAEAERRELEAREKRAGRDQIREQAERLLRVRNLITGNEIRPGRGHRFWHRTADGSSLSRMQVSSGVAAKLRSGELGIAALDHGTRVQYAVVPARAARTLIDIAPSVVVFFVQDTSGISEAAEAFLPELPEPDLRARRATSADVRRLREASAPVPRTAS